MASLPSSSDLAAAASAEKWENILENKSLYVHQYLTAIFQLSSSSANAKASSISSSQANLNGQIPVKCLLVQDVDDELLSLDNYTNMVFENLMSPNKLHVVSYVDKRFMNTENDSLFTSTYRVYNDDHNVVAYLFNCYCRLELIKDFANLISEKDKKRLKRYVIDQVALLLLCPYVNGRYSASEAVDEEQERLQSANQLGHHHQPPHSSPPKPAPITPYRDLFAVMTSNIPWPSSYLNYVKVNFHDS